MARSLMSSARSSSGRAAASSPCSFSTQARFAASYLKKGRLLYVEGRLHWSSWQAADGSQRRGCEVRVGNLQVLDQRPQPSEQPEGEGQ